MKIAGWHIRSLLIAVVALAMSASLTLGAAAPQASFGQIVCWAAHQETPEGYRNHGAWVSEWARSQHGSPSATKSNGKSNGKANGKSNRD